jgi:hypothetical protein
MTKDSTPDKGRLLQSALELELDALPPSQWEQLSGAYRENEPLRAASPQQRKRWAEVINRSR